MADSFYWYDLETTGTETANDRILQFAGQRTDLALNPLGDPDNFLVKPTEDVIPDPGAIAVTGLSMQQLQKEGITDFALAGLIQSLFSQSETCIAGFNNLRFDDEFVRRALYRNLIDPYEREWSGGNSRWDLIDLVCMAFALRPDGIEWPEVNGRVTMKLSEITRANQLQHEDAHDALSDVNATIALAKLVKDRQPRLFDWYLRARNKRFVQGHLRPFLHEPRVHISINYGAAKNFLSVVLPVSVHPVYENQIICLNLMEDPAELLHADAKTLREKAFMQGRARRLVSIACNRCPALAPFAVLQTARERLSLPLAQLQRYAKRIRQADVPVKRKFVETVREVFMQEERKLDPDPENQIYSGPFFDDTDKAAMKRLHHNPETALDLPLSETFRDPRLPELWFRARARHCRDDLSPEEEARWQAICQMRLKESGRLDSFADELHKARLEAGKENPETRVDPAKLDELEAWVQAITSGCGATLMPAKEQPVNS